MCMNVYNIKMENLTYTKGYYGSAPEELMMDMQTKMRYDGITNLLAWHYMTEVSRAQHTLTSSSHYLMHRNWKKYLAREHNITDK